MIVGDREVLANGGLRGVDTSVRASLNLLLAQKREPAFNDIEPRDNRRREVPMKPRVPYEPPPRAGRLVRAVLVED